MLLFSVLLYIAFLDIEALMVPLFGTSFANLNDIFKILILVVLMTFPAIKNQNYAIRLTHKQLPFAGQVDIVVFFTVIVLIAWQMGLFILISAVTSFVILMVVRKWNIT